jgi:hypothetical protein
VGFPKYDFSEDEMKKWIDHIAFICLSEEFQRLKDELEMLYLASSADTDTEEAKLNAFSDALYAFLAEKET